jgi:hypothetical protein
MSPDVQFSGMHSILLWVLSGGAAVLAAALLWLFRRRDLPVDR